MDNLSSFALSTSMAVIKQCQRNTVLHKSPEKNTNEAQT